MFCSNCGTQIEDHARFCYNCGSAITQNASQPGNYQQPNAYQQNYQDKFGVNIVYPDGHNEIGDLYITATEMVFVKKSKAVRLAFGFLGSALENGEATLRLNIADIVRGGRTKIGLNPHVYQITLRNGEAYKLCVNNPAKLSYLEGRFG